MNVCLKKNKAFSLIELMISIFILSIGVFGISQLLARTLFTDQTSKVNTAAVTLARQEIEQLRGIGYANVTNGNDSVTEDAAVYSRSWVITAPTGSLRR